MQNSVRQAEAHGGGWVTFVLHAICNGCDSWAITLTRLLAFVKWLAPRAAGGTHVKTVAEVMGAGSSGFRRP